ncbi:murein transglycosylase, variant 1 [Blastomyces dermatitidis ER-3]|uniref:Crh-like protein n=2 Tax=Blastomyces TaxID=229219 RepID=A0A179UHL4_BLAGS|nr:murein transglycosylase, variant 1 [Blastomyces gilchristii SLH14081]XP_045278830.1 murein transglycosylase, variant 1 [Blastomyces dermatitidis ER-3]EEQ92526.1 murein transglycosylase, variant 1 [Blastomyces dermatitidis ER-3]EQL31548.1 murein transglycosylase, variant 1 [Blastomyces dermatitidis ATCC 26199]OAT07243.1 murein transglycosylase, variant 1 [Blastomyces gilchristii SLH14081]
MKLSSGSVAALAMSLFSGSSLVAAQTWTACNPMQKTCPPNPALGGTADFEFHTASARFDILGGSPSYGADGASLAVAKQGDSPTLISKFYIMFGHVEFVIKAASGRGIVSSAVLQSDTLDEVDWEWLGVDNGRVQTNYFGKNQQGTFDRGQFHSNPGNQNGYHTYSIDWDSQRILWQIDGSTVRTLTAAEAGASYPQTPMQVKAGVWAGGDPTNPPGTIEWAGGPTDYSAGPYVMGLKSIAVTDYSTGTEYRYTDTSGNWGSIEAVGGKVNGRGTPGSGQQVESSIPPAEATRPPPTKGLPSDWIVTDSGRASTPSTASRTSQPTSQSSPSSSASSSARGPESSPSITATGFVTSPTVTPSPSATDSAGATVAPGTGAANGNFHMSYGVAAMCALIGAVVAF